MLSEKVARLSFKDGQSAPDPATQTGASTTSDGDGSVSDLPPAVRDVTEEFNKAAKALRMGLLVKDPNFTLYDAVGALEIMDPKMDSGFVMGEESSENAYDVTKELSPQEVIGIMDQLFCFEMTWHDGFPLTQCLFASSYIDRILCKDAKSFEEAGFHEGASIPDGNDLLHTILRAYCLALIKTCHFVHARITRERYFEDEDFSSNLYGRELLSGIDVEKINDFLQEGLDFLEQMDMANDLRDALQARLKLRHLMLYATEFENSMDRENTQPLYFCLELIPKIESTHQLGTHVPGAYDKTSQATLASTMPPRDLVKFTLEKALTKFTAMCSWLGYIYFILNPTTPSNMLNFVRYTMSVDPQPSVYVRCMLQALIWHDQLVLGSTSYQELIIADLVHTVLPSSEILKAENQVCEVPSDPRFKMAKAMDSFYNKVVDHYLDMFSTLCMNRARHRRMLSHLVADWDELETAALESDEALRLISAPKSDSQWFNALQMWAAAYKLGQMQGVVQMGFELNLYQMDEMAGMYWCVYHLCLLRMTNLERTMSHLKGRSRRAMANKQKKEIEDAIEHQKACFDEAFAVSCLADSLSCLYSFFAHVGLVPAPYRNVSYAEGEKRFHERVQYFWPVSDPPLPNFQDFLARVALRATPDDNAAVAKVLYRTMTKHQALGILELAARKSQMAKEAWQSIAKWTAERAQSRHCDDKRVNDAKNVMKACITAKMRVADFKKTLSNIDDSNIKDLKDYLRVDLPSAEAAHHKWWLVPQAVQIDQGEGERRREL